MAEKKPIDLFAGIKDVSGKGKAGQKFAIQIKAESLWFNPDERSLVQPIADAIAKTIGDNLRAGRTPSGGSMPGIASSTTEWREREAAQGARGGEADPKYKDLKFRMGVKKNYLRDYTAARLGAFTPKAGGPRGVVSGMLATSFSARPTRDGKGFIIYVASKRGRPRFGETLSALQTTFSGVPLWSSTAMEQPEIRKGMKESAARMLSKNLHGIKHMIREAGKIGRELRQISGELADEGED